MARFHKLPKAWSELMSRKNWATISEETLHQEAAALAFLRRYMEDNMGNRGVSISHGCLSKFAMERAIMCRLQGKRIPGLLNMWGPWSLECTVLAA
jgi:hypothetical protein